MSACSVKVIMDDILVFSSLKDHHKLLKMLYALLRKYGLKISPHKCQLYQTRIEYMGIVFEIVNDKPSYVPMKSKCEVIHNLLHPGSITEVRKFCGMVNFLSSFLKDLRKTLMPIYNLLQKRTPFNWTEECQIAFDTIKQQLANPPTLRMPTADGLLRLESDTSIYAAGGVLYQKQDDEWVLLGSHSKRMPPEVAKYGITELELAGLVVNVHGFKHLLYARLFEIIVDHKALERLVIAKSDFPTVRMQQLLFKLRRYDFTIKYKKGKELVMSDALSQLPFIEQTALADVIPLNFLVHLSEISVAALQQEEELLAQVLYPSLEVIVEQRKCDVDKQHSGENNQLLRGIQIPHQQNTQSNKPSGGIGMPAMVFALKPATRPTNQIRKADGGVKQLKNIPAEWVQNIYEMNSAPPQKCRNSSTKYLE